MNDFQLVNPENPDLCDFTKSQWYTPQWLADRIAEWATSIWANERLEVLEPNCGQGALVRALVARGCEVHGYDIDPVNTRHCNQEFDGTFIATDFLTREPLDRGGQYDLVVMNPPFEDGAAEAHVLHALKFALRVVAHVPLTTLAGKDRREGLWATAYLKRLAINATRPKYSGCKTGGQTDMCTIDVVRRPELHPVEVSASGVSVEWWA
jgi:predicted RNA methylase